MEDASHAAEPKMFLVKKCNENIKVLLCLLPPSPPLDAFNDYLAPADPVECLAVDSYYCSSLLRSCACHRSKTVSWPSEASPDDSEGFLG